MAKLVISLQPIVIVIIRTTHTVGPGTVHNTNHFRIHVTHSVQS